MKDTELGPLPLSWEAKLLEPILEKLIDYRGKTPKKSDKGIITLSARSVKMGYIDYDLAYHIDKETYDKFMVRGFPEVGDILLTTEAPLGCVATLDKDNVCVAQRLLTLRGKDGVLDNEYLKYYLMSRQGQHQLLSRATGSTVQGIKRTEFKKVLIALPPIKEQKMISKNLSEIDGYISKCNEINKTLESICSTVFNSWFVSFEPVKAKVLTNEAGGDDEEVSLSAMSCISGKSKIELLSLKKSDPQSYDEIKRVSDLFPSEMENSELGLIPKGWMLKKVSAFAKVIKGKSYKSSELKESKTALVTLKSFNRGGGYRLDGLKEYDGKYKREQEVFAGELIIAYTDVTQAADVIGKPAMVVSDERYEHLVISLDVAVVRPCNGNMNNFLYGLAQSDKFQQHMHSHSTGTTVLHLSKNAVPDYEFLFPGEDLVTAYESFTSPFFKEINRNISEKRVMETLHETLLPELMSGRLSRE